MLPLPRRRARLAAALLVVVALGAGACGRSSSGDGFQLTAGQLTAQQAATTAPTTEPPPGETVPPATDAPTTLPPPEQARTGFPTTVATVKGTVLQVFAVKPTPEQVAAAGGAGGSGGSDGGTSNGGGSSGFQPTSGGGADDPTFQPASLAVPAAPAVAPIPREGLPTAPYLEKTLYGWAIGSPTSFGNPVDVLVVQNDGDWLKVLLPVRPNQTEGWIRASDVELSSHSFRLELRLSTFSLTAYNGGNVIAQTKVVVGKPTSPTPEGRFYMNEKVKGDGGTYGPWILSTNGYSEALEEFDGGLPVIAFHGTNQPNLLGTRNSNGCVRMPNDVVTKLHDLLPAGTPIDILP